MSQNESESVVIDGNNFAVFGYGDMEGDCEQLTNWNTIESARKSKENWHEKDRTRFIMARVRE